MTVEFHHDEQHATGRIWTAWLGDKQLGEFHSGKQRSMNQGFYYTQAGELVRVERRLTAWKDQVRTEWEHEG